MTSARLLYVTAKDRAEALRIGRTLVGSRLAACANVLPGVESIYWWEGAVQQEPEAVLILKTAENKVEQVVEAVRKLHSYTCPCVVSLPIEAGNPAYLAWIAEQTSAGSTDG
jgi:periplasmic divalent cation tolerance protein